MSSPQMTRMLGLRVRRAAGFAFPDDAALPFVAMFPPLWLKAPQPVARSRDDCSCVCPTTDHPALRTGGGFQRSSRMSGFGQYARIYSENSSFGVGTQFDSLSAPGEACWKCSVSEPSGACFIDLLLVPSE